jgi:hypothetical protein
LFVGVDQILADLIQLACAQWVISQLVPNLSLVELYGCSLIRALSFNRLLEARSESPQSWAGFLSRMPISPFASAVLRAASI